jgi:hypothetical protein
MKADKKKQQKNKMRDTRTRKETQQIRIGDDKKREGNT